MDGAPVVPMAVALELMAELAQKGWPDLQVIGVREMQMLKGVVLDKGPRPVKVIARAQVEPPHDRTGIDVNVEVRDASGSGHLCYRATVELGAAHPGGAALPRRATASSCGEFPLCLDQAPTGSGSSTDRACRASAQIYGLCDRAIDGVLDASAPPPCFDAPSEGRWLIDPVMFDSAPAALRALVARAARQDDAPSRFSRYRRFGSLSDSKVALLHARAGPLARSPVLHERSVRGSRRTRLLGLLEEMEGACSRALNRLANAQADRALTGAVADSPSL